MADLWFSAMVSVRRVLCDRTYCDDENRHERRSCQFINIATTRIR
jgi:hypothetical protein